MGMKGNYATGSHRKFDKPFNMDPYMNQSGFAWNVVSGFSRLQKIAKNVESSTGKEDSWLVNLPPPYRTPPRNKGLIRFNKVLLRKPNG